MSSVGYPSIRINPEKVARQAKTLGISLAVFSRRIFERSSGRQRPLETLLLSFPKPCVYQHCYFFFESTRFGNYKTKILGLSRLTYFVHFMAIIKRNDWVYWRPPWLKIKSLQGGTPPEGLYWRPPWLKIKSLQGGTPPEGLYWRPPWLKIK